MATAIELDHHADEALRQTLDYWLQLRGPRRMPARKDLNPADIPKLLPKLMLADVGETQNGADVPSIRFRLVGTEVVGRFGYELTGFDLTEIDYGIHTDEIAALYRQAVDCGQPQFAQIDFWQSRDRLIRMQQLLLPLSDDGTNVNMILAVVHCQ